MRVSNIILEDKHGHGKWRQVFHNTFMNYEHCVKRFWWHKLATHAQLGKGSCYLQNLQQLKLWGSSTPKETLHTNGLVLCRKTWVIILGSTTPKSEQPSQREKWTPFRSGATLGQVRKPCKDYSSSLKSIPAEWWLQGYRADFSLALIF